MLTDVEAVWNLLTTNYMYVQRERTGTELAALLDIWKQLLADIPPEILKAAALQHIATSKWFPSIAELRALAREIIYPSRLCGVEAWGLVKREIHRVGIYGKPKFDDEFIAVAVKTLGWDSLCMGDHEPSNRARFIACYDALVQREEKQMALLPQVRNVIEHLDQLLLESSVKAE